MALDSAFPTGMNAVLSAMCLALFNQGLSALSVSPAQSAFQAGCAAGQPGENFVGLEGFAEVDFLGVDKRIYRARREVVRDRADSAPDRLRPIMTLRDVAAGVEVAGGDPKDTIEPVFSRLGWSFDRFRHILLLSQSDFSAFLTRPAPERSRMFDRIVDLGIFSGLSRLIHETMASEEAGHAETLRRLKAMQPLSAEERRELTERRTQLETAMETACSDLEWLNRELIWFERLDELHHRLTQASHVVFQAKQAFGDLDADRKRLEEVKAVLTLRAPLKELETIEGEVAVVAWTAARLKREVAENEAALQEREIALKDQMKRLLTVRQELERSQPLLARARVLDSLIEARKKNHERARDAWKEASQQTETAHRMWIAAKEAREAKDREFCELDTWLRKNESLIRLSAEWGRVKQDVARFQVARDAFRKVNGEFEAARDHLNTAKSEALAVREAFDQAVQLMDSTREKLARAAKEAQPYDLGELYPKLDVKKEEAERLTRVQNHLQALFQVQMDLEELSREQQENLTRQKELERETIGLELEWRERMPALQVAEEKKRLLVIENLAELRLNLVAGSPCPVCGGKDHPWAERPAPSNEEMTQVSLEFARLSEQVNGLQGQIAGNRARIQEREALSGKLAQRLSSAQKEWELQEREFAQKCSASGVEPRKADSHFAVFLGESIQKAEQEIIGIKERIQRGLDLQKQVGDLHKDADRGNRDLGEKQRDFDRRQNVVKEAQFRYDRLVENRSERESAREICLMGLFDHFSDWKDWQNELEEDPDRFLMRWEAAIREFRHKSEEKERLAKDLATGAPFVTDLEGTWRSVGAQEADKKTAMETIWQQLKESARDRDGFFQGRPSDEWEKELVGRIQAAEADLEKAKDHLRETMRLGGETQAASGHWVEQEQKGRARADQCRESIQVLLRGRGVDLEELRARLSHDEAWFQQVTERLHSAQGELEASFFQEKECQKDIEAHYAVRPRRPRAEGTPGGPVGDNAGKTREMVLLEKNQTLTAVTEWQEQVNVICNRLRADENRAQEFLLEERKLEAREQNLVVRRELDSLIGSPDGQVFRNFARDVFFEQILLLADQHLRELFPRYRLRKSPENDLEFFLVDGHFGDEWREMSRFSAAERFMVSMVLAMGLRSLRVPQRKGQGGEGVFICEEFAAGDAASLELILTFLNAVAASGQRVVILSPSPEMRERVGLQMEMIPDEAGNGRVRILEMLRL
jgi:exonuclease SbcC